MEAWAGKLPTHCVSIFTMPATFVSPSEAHKFQDKDNTHYELRPIKSLDASLWGFRTQFFYIFGELLCRVIFVSMVPDHQVCSGSFLMDQS